MFSQRIAPVRVLFLETICNEEVSVEEPASMMPVIIGVVVGVAVLVAVGLILLCKFKKWACFKNDWKVGDAEKKQLTDKVGSPGQSRDEMTPIHSMDSGRMPVMSVAVAQPARVNWQDPKAQENELKKLQALNAI